ncbi:hypothetical protein COOONC_27731 [Cooperia oncophora]
MDSDPPATESLSELGGIRGLMAGSMSSQPRQDVDGHPPPPVTQLSEQETASAGYWYAKSQVLELHHLNGFPVFQTEVTHFMTLSFNFFYFRVLPD